MSKAHHCNARRYGDQMICAPCGLIWDVNDPEPPACRKSADALWIAKHGSEPTLSPAHKSPELLPDDVAAEMVTVYQANGGGVTGMRAAHRLFLDRSADE